MINTPSHINLHKIKTFPEGDQFPASYQGTFDFIF